jgi:hypothetical protein
MAYYNLSSGTGSSAWYSSATHIHPDTIQAVLREANVVHNADTVKQITDNLDLICKTNSQT